MSFFSRIRNYLRFSREEVDDSILSLIILGICVYIMYLGKPFVSKISPEDYKYGDLTYGVFSEGRLSDFNGIKEQKLYLSVLGSVFDVSKGARHYAKGGPYHYFVGKDGSRALITGHFMDESENKDNIVDLPCDDIFHLLNWKATFQKKYVQVGVLKGRFYDKNGKETVYYKELLHRINQCVEDKKASREQEDKYPPCNIVWYSDKGTKVWCTKNSGGISRDWVGVPRQLYEPGREKPLCVCVNLESKENEDKAIGQFKKFDKCPSTATSCSVDITSIL